MPHDDASVRHRVPRHRILYFVDFSLTRLQSNARLRRIGAGVGLALLVAAIAIAWRQRETVLQALGSIGQLPRGVLALHAATLLGSVVLNVVLSGFLFSLLMSRYGKVGILEMQALIASATLLNFVPMRPGLFGRVAYHRVYNHIAVTQSAAVIVQAVGLSALIAGYVVLAVLCSLRFSIDLWVLIAAPLPILVAGATMKASFRVWCRAGLVRYLDVLVTAARYYAAFALIGSPIHASGAVAFACISVIATMVPFLSNGLGLREWAVGLVAPLLTPYQMTLGITADLVNRAAEIVAALALGLIGMAILARIQTRRASNRNV